MRTLTIYGASDDLVEIEDTGGPGFELGTEGTRFQVRRSDGKGGLEVSVAYGDDGAWAIATAPGMDGESDDGEYGIPPHWTLSLRQGRGRLPQGDGYPVYSMVLVAEVDDDIVFRWLDTNPEASDAD